MDIVRLFRNPFTSLCGPSLFYLIVSAVVLLSVFIQNVGNNSHQHIVVVNSAIRTPSKLLVFIVNHPEIAWLVVLFPYIIIALFFVIIMLNKP
jgi:hypothetical protein